MGPQSQHPVRIYFFPLMSPGHMIPMIDMAKLFARHGVSATIITTPGNESLVRPAIDRANSSSLPEFPIKLILIPFPSSVTHLLRNGKENLTSLTSSDFPDFFVAFFALQQPLHDLLQAHRPDFIISDAMFTWTADTAIALNIPRIVFYGHGIFASCVHESLELHAPYSKVSNDSEVFVVEGLPHHIEMTRPEVSPSIPYLSSSYREAEEKSYGVVVNSFYKLVPEYAELYRKKPGRSRRAYYVGPVSLSNKESVEKADRGQKLNPKIQGLIMTWLESMEKGSVVYVCFGSLNEFSGDQLREIALGLEASRQPFVWVVRNYTDTDDCCWLPKGIEERVEGKGVVIKGWAPQIAILNHEAVGGFVTHCGWNSTLEGLSAGVPMVTWPVEYEQFVNEKLITQVLEIGVSVGRGEIVGDDGRKKVVRAQEIAKAVKQVMSGEGEAEERRMRARKYAAMAEAAMDEGGSSFMDLTRLIDEIKEYQIVAGGIKTTA